MYCVPMITTGYFFQIFIFNCFELCSKVQILTFLIFLNIRSGVISCGYPLGP